MGGGAGGAGGGGSGLDCSRSLQSNIVSRNAGKLDKNFTTLFTALSELRIISILYQLVCHLDMMSPSLKSAWFAITLLWLVLLTIELYKVN